MPKKEDNISLIAAVALNGAIGRGNALLWHISEDMKFFKETTMGGSIIMGRKTFESIGRALPGRLNIVISRGCPDLPEGVVTVHSLAEAVQAAVDSKRSGIFITGGGQIYAQAMDIADTLLITRVFASPQDADTFFPAIEADKWDIVSQSEISSTPEGLSYRFERWERVCERD